ncbi:MAG: BPH-5 domain-containing protein [Oscillospiraceae bacterium]|jgi:hypothetical protein
MDIFVEQLIKKKFSPKDYLFICAVILASVVLVFLAVVLIPQFAIFILACIIYADYNLITSRSLEFEYSVTNGDITIDKIIYRRKRKHVISVDAHTVEEMGKYDANKHSGKTYAARIFASETDSGENAWFFTAHHPQKGNVLVVFNPNEKTLDAIRPFLPRQVARDAFGRN